ncbi:hypothetical protein PR048_007918 [Dryococelus australis]|uniref:Uncharacterized protein n=1 Tax=Dryococelus australis TaxID=614101 RepID=A0ABQ9HX90_9NEOP|nr:hypothetical protein PR048_007918 [Dryococelus australis]
MGKGCAVESLFRSAGAVIRGCRHVPGLIRAAVPWHTSSVIHAGRAHRSQPLGGRGGGCDLRPSCNFDRWEARVVQGLDAVRGREVRRGGGEILNTTDKNIGRQLSLALSGEGGPCGSPPTEANRASIPGRVAPGLSHVGIVLDDAAGPRVSSGSPVSPTLQFRRCFIFTSITLIGCQDLAVKSRPNLFTHTHLMRVAGSHLSLPRFLASNAENGCSKRLRDLAVLVVVQVAVISDWLFLSLCMMPSPTGCCGPAKFALLLYIRLNITVVYVKETASFLRWLQHRREVAPFSLNST